MVILGYHGPRWTPEDIAILGAVPDPEFARRTHRSVNAVRQTRYPVGNP
jgi:hypothetical protein